MDSDILGDPSLTATVSVTPPSSLSPNSRKRNRENETPSQRIKREKAAERQRRKRERDRLGVSAQSQAQQQAQVAYHVQQVHQVVQQQQVNGHPSQIHAHPGQLQHHPPAPESVGMVEEESRVSKREYEDRDLTPEEIARRDRVREAAKMRQRKHRKLVKERKMREMGLEMGAVVPTGVPVGVGPSGEEIYQGGYPVLPPELQSGLPPHAIAHIDPNQPHEPPFPQGQGHGGQTFATTLLLSFSCSPLLKQHLLNSLQMTNEELASLEPIIADAWDQWDRQRRHHYEQQGAPLPATYTPMTGPPPAYIQPASTTTSATSSTSSAPSSANTANGAQNGGASASANSAASTNASANEFRARFHRSLVVPTPFQAQAAAAVAGKGVGSTVGKAGASAGAQGAGGHEAIDPRLDGSKSEG